MLGRFGAVDVRDLAMRAWHTFYQTFVSVLGVVWAASGMDVSQVVDLDSAKKIALSALAAVAAAAISAAKTTALGLLSSGGMPVEDSDMGTGHLAPIEVAVVDNYRPEHAAV